MVLARWPPRELFFVRRILDGRRSAILVSNGESRFHTTSVENLAEMIRLAAANPGTRVLNCGDPESPTTREIGEAISRAMNAELELVGIPESGLERPELGNPWGVPRPFLLDMHAPSATSATSRSRRMRTPCPQPARGSSKS
jgi:nucleoside-diphosphate-sugar epimerase